jgi:hypothetical protein
LSKLTSSKALQHGPIWGETGAVAVEEPIDGGANQVARLRRVRSSPPHAKKRRVLACPVLYRSGAPVRTKLRTPMLLKLKSNSKRAGRLADHFPLSARSACPH